MIVAIAHHKGGVGKTTTAVHLAAFLQTQAPTLLLDGDRSRTATKWGARGPGFPFRVADERQAAKLARDFKHVVIDTAQGPTDDELRELAQACDLMVVPGVPASMDTDGLVDTLRALASFGASNYRVLITKEPPPPEPEGPALRADLTAEGVPLFRASIPRLKAFEKAAASGVTVDALTGDPRAPRAWEAYSAAGREVLEHGQ